MGGLTSRPHGGDEGPAQRSTASGDSGCGRLARGAIEHFASGAPLREASHAEAAAHLAVCPACAAAVAHARESLAFLQSVGPLLRARTDPGGAAPARRIDGSDTRLLHGYRLVEPIGEGGQGSVWRAVHEPSGRTSAVKIIRHATVQQRARMQREARLAAGLRHPGIVAVYDCGALPDSGFAIAMELVEGAPFDEWARAIESSGQSPAQRLRRVVRALVRVCDALHHAHQQGVIHRDLKPANILVCADDLPRVVDFGLARAAGEGAGQTVTRTGEFAGTLAYAAPEQFVPGASPGSPADIYALGVMLYEVLVERLPFAQDDSIDRYIAAVRGSAPAAPARTASGRTVDRDLLTVALKALEKDPGRRYESVAALRADLVRWLEGRPVEARRVGSFELFTRFVRRHWIASAGVALGIAGLAGLLAVMTVLWLYAERAKTGFERLYTRAQAALSHSSSSYARSEQALASLGDYARAESSARAAAETALAETRTALARRRVDAARSAVAAGDREGGVGEAWGALVAALTPGGPSGAIDPAGAEAAWGFLAEHAGEGEEERLADALRRLDAAGQGEGPGADWVRLRDEGSAPGATPPPARE